MGSMAAFDRSSDDLLSESHPLSYQLVGSSLSS